MLAKNMITCGECCKELKRELVNAVKNLVANYSIILVFGFDRMFTANVNYIFKFYFTLIPILRYVTTIIIHFFKIRFENSKSNFQFQWNTICQFQ